MTWRILWSVPGLGVIGLLLFNGCAKETVGGPGVGSPVFPRDSISADMTGPNEAFPHGVPSGYDWASGPAIANHAGNNPGDRRAVVAWGQIHEAIEGSSTLNVRVQIRDLGGLWLHSSNGQWQLLQRTRTVWGSLYYEDFVPNDNWPADTVSVPGEGLAVRMADERSFHFYWQDRSEIDPEDIAGFVFWFEARLVLDDPGGPDQLDQARYVASAGADYYLSTTSKDDAENVAHGKTKYVRRDWRRYHMTTLSAEQLDDNPPPFP